MQKRVFTFLLLLISIAGLGNRNEPFILGESITFRSEILNEDRILNVYLPEGYSNDSSQTYPVIYLLDGSKTEDFIHIVGLVQFATYPWINLIDKSIVVGISNVDRKRDFTFPTHIKKDKKEFPTTGGSQRFIQCLKDEIQPLIESTYKTNTVKTIIGQSLGGLLATEILFKYSSLFSNYIIISPSLWWDGQSLFQKIPDQFSRVNSVYIGVGKEGKIMRHDAKKLYKELKSKIDAIHFQFFPEYNHGDVLHQAVYDAFSKLTI